MDTIYKFADYGKDSRPRLQFPKRTGRRTSYREWLAYQYALHHDGELPAIGSDIPPAPAFVNHGRWLWLCPGCLSSVQISETGDGADLVCCPCCFGQGFVQPSFPDAKAEIEAELLRQPGYRHNAPFRNWEPGWSLAYLRERTAAAQAKIAAGETFVRSASIGTPRTWAVGEVLTAANMNTFILEIQKDLIGTNGPVELLHGMRPGSFTTTELAALVAAPDGTMFYDKTLDRLRYKNASDISPIGLRRHESGLLYPSDLTSRSAIVTHDIGATPFAFFAYLERTKLSGTNNGYGFGDRIFLGDWARANNEPGRWQVTDISSTTYSVRFVSTSARIATKISPETTSTVTLSSSGGWAARIVALG